MGEKGWKENDPTLQELTSDEIVVFALEQEQQDRQAYLLFRVWKWLLWPLCFCVTLSLLLLIGWLLSVSDLQQAKVFTMTLIFFPAWVFIADYTAPSRLRAAQRRRARLHSLLQTHLPQTSAATALPTLLRTRARLPVPLRQSLDRGLVHLLTPMSGEAVFALPFETRAELARIAEDLSTSLELAVVILLALTSARDGNVQPVLRRLSKDARSLRLREVAAECLREFSAAP